MKFLVDFLHPAHVHVFRGFIREMESRGHEFYLTARDKDCTLELLDRYSLSADVLSRQASSGLGLGVELVARTVKLWRRARRFRPDVLLGIMGPSIALAGRFLPSKTVIFYDTEMARITNSFAYPLADAVVTPECYAAEVPGLHVRYPGYHELAYLHPNRFTPDPAILHRHGLRTDRPIYVVRFVSWQASHDLAEKGFSLDAKRRLVASLAERGQVCITSEAALPDDLATYRSPVPIDAIHHLLAAADLLVGESATMASEAAVLGTPAIFVSKTGRGYTDEQERRYGLVRHFTDDQEAEALAEVARLLAKNDLRTDAAERRARLLAERIDVTAWMIDFFERGAFAGIA